MAKPEMLPTITSRGVCALSANLADITKPAITITTTVGIRSPFTSETLFMGNNMPAMPHIARL